MKVVSIVCHPVLLFKDRWVVCFSPGGHCWVHSDGRQVHVRIGLTVGGFPG